MLAEREIVLDEQPRSLSRSFRLTGVTYFAQPGGVPSAERLV